jgi:hypothetical protein
MLARKREAGVLRIPFQISDLKLVSESDWDLEI